MKSIMFNILKFFILLSCIIHVNCHASIPTDNSLAPMLQKVLPAVVNIRAQVKVTDLNTLNRLQQELGQDSSNQGNQIPDKFVSVASGVIVDADKGYILTNAHVIADALSVTITLNDGRHY